MAKHEAEQSAASAKQPAVTIRPIGRGLDQNRQIDRPTRGPSPLQLAALLGVAALLVLLILGPAMLAPWKAEPTSTRSPSAGALSGPSASAPSASQSPVPVGSNPGACLNIVAHPVKAANTVAGESAYSDVVLIGSIVGIGEGRWATPDGSPPPGPGVPLVSDVYRLVSVKVTAVGKATGTSASKAVPGRTIEVRVLGGRIGCSRWAIDGQPEMVAGQGVGLFLGSQPPLQNAPAADFDVVDNWPIANGRFSENGKSITPEAFLSASLGK
jgi:hypothetical protein